MEFTQFLRKPFVIEAIEVTKENIEDIAEFVGTLQHKEDGTPYIAVNRRMVPNVFRVYPGFWMTKMGENIRCYSKKVFVQQFVELTEDMTAWVDYLNGEEDAPEEVPDA